MLILALGAVGVSREQAIDDVERRIVSRRQVQRQIAALILALGAVGVSREQAIDDVERRIASRHMVQR